MKKRRMIGILILIATIIIAIVYFVTRLAKEEKGNKELENKVKEEFVQVLDDGTKVNTSTKLKEAKNVKGLTFQNIQLTDKKEQTVLLADVTNNSGKNTETMLIDIILYDKQGNEIVTIPGILSPMKKGASSILKAGITTNYANAYDFKIVIK